MQPDFFCQALDHLSKSHFGRTWPNESMIVAASDLANIPDAAMIAAVKRIRLEISPASLPPLKRVTDIIQEEAKQINLANSPAEPKSRQDNDRDFRSRFGERANQHAHYALKIMAMATDPEIPHEKVLEGLQVMAKQFPGIGWEDCIADHIRQHRAEDSYDDNQRRAEGD